MWAHSQEPSCVSDLSPSTCLRAPANDAQRPEQEASALSLHLQGCLRPLLWPLPQVSPVPAWDLLLQARTPPTLHGLRGTSQSLEQGLSWVGAISCSHPQTVSPGMRLCLPWSLGLLVSRPWWVLMSESGPSLLGCSSCSEMALQLLP